jgi:uncharacterized protein YbaR (Trm112 family)
MLSKTPCPVCKGNLEVLESSEIGKWKYTCRQCSKRFVLNIQGEMHEEHLGEAMDIFKDIFK